MRFVLRGLLFHPAFDACVLHLRIRAGVAASSTCFGFSATADDDYTAQGRPLEPCKWMQRHATNLRLMEVFAMQHASCSCERRTRPLFERGLHSQTCGKHRSKRSRSHPDAVNGRIVLHIRLPTYCPPPSKHLSLRNNTMQRLDFHSQQTPTAAAACCSAKI